MARNLVTDVAQGFSPVNAANAPTGDAPRVPILYLTDRAEIGGAERRLLDLARWIDPARFELSFCTLSGGGLLIDELRRTGHATYTLDVERGLDYPRAIARAVSLVRQLRPSILHGQVRYASFVAGLVGRMCRVPVVLSTRTYTTRLGHHAFLDWWTSRLVHHTIAVSSAARDIVVNMEGIDPQRVAVIENGIDLDEFAAPPAARVERARTELGLFGRAVVGTVGNLHPIKGHEYLVRSIAQVRRTAPNAALLIVGDGNLRSSLMAVAREEGVADAVVFTGFRDDIPVLLGAMDVFVLPSLNEGMSHALLEAMALKRPVIATAVGGNTDVVEPNVSGLLVPSKDPDALAEAITAIFAQPDRAQRLGEAAQARVHERFSTHRMVAEYVSLYDALLPDESTATRMWRRPSGLRADRRAEALRHR